MSFPNWNSVANRKKKWARDRYSRYLSISSTYKKQNINIEDKLKHKPYTVGQVKTIIKLAYKLERPEMLMEFKINNSYDAGLVIMRLKKLVNVA
jgi:uncharacterized protein VirK/YbjX